MKKPFFILLIAICTTANAQYTLLTDFSGNGAFNGARPQNDQNLISVGGALYGMTYYGGINDMGVVFKIMPDGTGYSKLLDFAGATNGRHPYGSLISDGTFLYGMTSYGGTNNRGVIFKIMPDGTGFSKLLDFAGGSNGSYPYGSLISDGTFLYGMTSDGGANGTGVVFKIMPDGTGYSNLFDFVGWGANGSYPFGSLVSDGTFLYGMTMYGGTNNMGVLFKIMPDGTGYSKLLDFAGVATGARPRGSLISDGTFLYGMTWVGGTNNNGVVFKIMPNGTSFSKLLDFAGAANGGPEGSLISDGTFLYGMTKVGGTNGAGFIFKIMPDGTGYSTLFDFAGGANGSVPYGSLVSDGTFLYGMTNRGGAYDDGVVFKLMPDGTGYSKLLDFTPAVNGRNPQGSLISDGTFLYGMTNDGGTNDMGVIFKIMPDGTGYSKLHTFAGLANGSNPYGSLVSDGTFLYGMTWTGGINSLGVVFKIMPDGTGYSTLLDFAGAANGSYPQGGGSLISDGTFLYGMTTYGGTNDMGVVFKIMPDGTGYSKLLDFAGAANGRAPFGSLVSDGTFLYGMTWGGGTNDRGVIFKIMPDGTGYSKLHDFNDGHWPVGSLIYDGTFLYGMTTYGGINGSGVVFKIMPDGTGYTKLLDFGGANGVWPSGSLISDGTFLYGMTYSGGISDSGVVFKIMPDGTGYSKILDFAGPNGARPLGSLYSDGTFLYGMTNTGGDLHIGTVFRHSLTIPSVSSVSTNQSISIFPNPSKGIFTFVFAGGGKQSEIEIYNVLGEKVAQRVIPVRSGNFEIDLSDHPDGIYFLQIKTEQGEVVGNKKIIISK